MRKTRLGLRDLLAARRRLSGVIKPTPLIPSATLSRIVGAEILLKPESLQKTGSFKIRGAYNRVAALSPSEKARGVVAASAGNHGQALSYAATRAGVSATIVMPKTAAISKVEATRGYGQAVKLEGADYPAALRAAHGLRRRTGATFVDAYDDPFVVAGQGTVGLEIAEEISPDAVLVPVGGGGLLAGIAAALSARAPRAEIIGVEAAGSPQLSRSLKNGTASRITGALDTVADGLATGRIGTVPFDLIRRHVSRVVSVDDFEIAEAVLLMLERLKLLAEGAGAAALAGAIKLKDRLVGKRVVVVVSGGNIDINLLDRIIGHGLSRMGRLVRFEINLKDRPGELATLLQQVGESGANVRAVDHDRARRDIRINAARVVLDLETRGPEHIESIRRALVRTGYEVRTEALGSTPQPHGS